MLNIRLLKVTVTAAFQFPWYQAIRGGVLFALQMQAIHLTWNRDAEQSEVGVLVPRNCVKRANLTSLPPDSRHKVLNH